MSTEKQITDETEEERKANEREKREQYEKDLRAPSRINETEMRNLILKALSEDNPENTPHNETFKEYGYKGSLDDLRSIVEFLAIQKKIITKVTEIHDQAWESTGERPRFGVSTNFNLAEQDTFIEVFYSLLYQNVVAVGNSNGFLQLPFFHVTSFGMKCLEEKDVLPFDQGEYLAAIKASNPDDWEEFYISEALRCYNCGAYSASVTMMGILGEYIAEQLINTLDIFLARNDQSLHTTYQTNMNGITKISQKYSKYEDMLDQVKSKKDANGAWIYPTIRALTPRLDASAKNVYHTYLRLTRNELAHPSDLKMERNETLMLFVSFIKYFNIQHQFLAALRALS